MKEISYDKAYYSRAEIRGLVKIIVRLIANLEVRLIAKKLKNKGSVLEIGCGNGKLTRELARFGFQIVGIDTSSEAIRLAKSLKGKVEFIKGDARELKFKDGQFDTVLCLHVLEHVQDAEGLTRESFRILRNGGTLWLRLPNGNSLEAKMAGKYWFHRDEPYHCHQWTDKEIVKILAEVGFIKVKVNYAILEFRQVLLYSILNFFGIKKISHQLKLAISPLQTLFVPLSFILGAVFRDSGTIEVLAEKG